MIPSQQSLRRPVDVAVARFEHLLAGASAAFDADQPELMERGRAVARLLQQRLDARTDQERPDARWSNARRLIDQAALLLASALRQDRPGMLARGTYGRCLDALASIAGAPGTANNAETLLASARRVALTAATPETTVAPPGAWAYCC